MTHSATRPASPGATGASGDRLDVGRLLSDRTRALGPSGIRKIFEAAATLKDPINLSIGQPDFPVPEPIKRAAIEAIDADHNGYTLSAGIPALRRRIGEHLAHDIGWRGVGDKGSDTGLIITSGTSGAILVMTMALLSPDDEIIIGDPYFVAYPHMATLSGGVAVRCPTYPDFRMTAERIEPLITPRTKAVMLNSPGNPSGVVMSKRECEDVLDLCRSKGVLLVSDEIYDEFTYRDFREPAGLPGNDEPRCPSPCRVPGSEADVLLIRGFGKTYGCTGWRMGYAAGPRELIEEMTKMQQYSFVCAPAPMQHACVKTFDVDMMPTVDRFQKRRDLVLEQLRPHARIETPGGAFYAFIELPERLGVSGTEFSTRAMERSLVCIPGGAFSERDTHIRISFAVDDDKLARGLAILGEMLQGG